MGAAWTPRSARSARPAWTARVSRLRVIAPSVNLRRSDGNRSEGSASPGDPFAVSSVRSRENRSVPNDRRRPPGPPPRPRPGPLDDLDHRLVALLAADGRLSNAALAEALGI